MYGVALEGTTIRAEPEAVRLHDRGAQGAAGRCGCRADAVAREDVHVVGGSVHNKAHELGGADVAAGAVGTVAVRRAGHATLICRRAPAEAAVQGRGQIAGVDRRASRERVDRDSGGADVVPEDARAEPGIGADR